MRVEPCRSYAARPAGTDCYRDGRTVFKVYYADIHGRDTPERFEWDLSSLERRAVLKALAGMAVEGVGFVISFPHVGKVFRFWPQAETIVTVRAFNPGDGSALPLHRGDGEVEFACLAEAVIAAQEYLFWAESRDVGQYLGRWAQWGDLGIVDQTKLARYWTAG